MDRKLLIIGVGGMLGNALYRYFDERTNNRTFGLLRNKKKILNFFNKFNSEKIIEKDFLDLNNLDQIPSDLSPNIIFPKPLKGSEDSNHFRIFLGLTFSLNLPLKTVSSFLFILIVNSS